MNMTKNFVFQKLGRANNLIQILTNQIKSRFFSREFLSLNKTTEAVIADVL